MDTAAVMVEPQAKPRGRSFVHRVASALAVGPGAFLLLLTMYSLRYFGGAWRRVFDPFGIPGGLPTTTQFVMDLCDGLATHWTASFVVWAALAVGLAIVAAAVRSRRAFKCAGAFSAACFLLWFGSLLLSLLALALPALTTMFGVGSRE